MMRRLVAISVFCSLFTSYAIAQNALKIKAQPSPLLKSEIPFYDLKAFDHYLIDGKAIYDFARQNQGTNFIIELEIDAKRQWQMELQASKVHGGDYKMIMSTGEEIEVEKHITYKGFLKNNPSVKVRMTITENLIHGVIFDEISYSFETVNKRVQRSASDLMVVYKMGENNAPSGSCGHDLNLLHIYLH